MKVILEAFGRKLKSEPMVWPNESPLDVRMELDMDQSAGYNPDRTLKTVLIQRIGRFIYSGYTQSLPDGTYARVYTLVDIS